MNANEFRKKITQIWNRRATHLPLRHWATINTVLVDFYCEKLNLAFDVIEINPKKADEKELEMRHQQIHDRLGDKIVYGFIYADNELHTNDDIWQALNGMIQSCAYRPGK